MLVLKRLSDHVAGTLDHLPPPQKETIKNCLGIPKDRTQFTAQELGQGLRELETRLTYPADRPQAASDLENILSNVNLPPSFREYEALLGKLAINFVRFADLEKQLIFYDEAKRELYFRNNSQQSDAIFRSEVEQKLGQFSADLSQTIAELAIEAFHSMDSLKALANSISIKQEFGFTIFVGAEEGFDFKPVDTISAQIIKDSVASLDKIGEAIRGCDIIRGNRSLSNFMNYSLGCLWQLVHPSELQQRSGERVGSLRSQLFSEISNEGAEHVRFGLSAYISKAALFLDKLENQTTVISDLSIIGSRPDTAVLLIRSAVTDLLSAQLNRAISPEEGYSIDRQLTQAAELDPDWGSFLKSPIKLIIDPSEINHERILVKLRLKLKSDQSRKALTHEAFTFFYKEKKSLAIPAFGIVEKSSEQELIDLVDELALIDRYTSERYAIDVAARCTHLLRKSYPLILNTETLGPSDLVFDQLDSMPAINQFSHIWETSRQLYSSQDTQETAIAWLKAISEELNKSKRFSLTDLVAVFFYFDAANFKDLAPKKDVALSISRAEVANIERKYDELIHIFPSAFYMMMCLLRAGEREKLLSLLNSRKIIIDSAGEGALTYFSQDIEKINADLVKSKVKNRPVKLSRLLEIGGSST